MVTTFRSSAGADFSLSSDAAGFAAADGFVSHLPEVLTELAESAKCHNWQLLGRLAHQLKDEGSSSGFDGLAPFAARLERAAVDRGSQLDIRVALDDLIAECRKVRTTCAV